MKHGNEFDKEHENEFHKIGKIINLENLKNENKFYKRRE